jgi:hypothetical protein
MCRDDWLYDINLLPRISEDAEEENTKQHAWRQWLISEFNGDGEEGRRNVPRGTLRTAQELGEADRETGKARNKRHLPGFPKRTRRERPLIISPEEEQLTVVAQEVPDEYQEFRINP